MIAIDKCHGCRNDFYNGKNPLGVKRCWSAEKGKMVTRYRIGTWTQPGSPGAFTEVRVPDCYHQTGQHFYKQVPDFVKADDIVRRKRTA